MGLMVNFNEDSLLALAPLEKKKKKAKRVERRKEGKETHNLFKRLTYKWDHNSNCRNVAGTIGVGEDQDVYCCCFCSHSSDYEYVDIFLKIVRHESIISSYHKSATHFVRNVCQSVLRVRSMISQRNRGERQR